MENLEKKISLLQNKIEAVDVSLNGWAKDDICHTVNKMMNSLEEEKFKLSIQQAKLVTRHTFLC